MRPRIGDVLRILFIIFLSIATLLTAAGWHARTLKRIAYWRWHPLPRLEFSCLVEDGKTTVDVTVWHVKPRKSVYGKVADITVPGISLRVSEYALRSRDEKHATIVGLCVSPWVLTGFTILAWLALPLVARRHRRRLRRKRGLCVKCGYDLTGNESRLCPECGDEVET